MTALLKEALKPNLVQTLENTPAIIHGGPFANIAHGCNSILATKTAMALSDYVVTEAGFGADLGAEKFLNIKCRHGNLQPHCVVMVATIRALKMHGGLSKSELQNEDVLALKRGLENLEKHLENIEKFNLPVVVAINQFHRDTQDEIDAVMKFCKDRGIECALSQVWEKGGAGGVDLAERVVSKIESNSEIKFSPLYELNLSIEEKIEKVAREIYGAEGVNYTQTVLKKMEDLSKAGGDRLPICVAKTQASLSDNPSLLGRPRGFKISVKDITLSAGAGFLVVHTGDIMTMPGLPKKPAAEGIDIDKDGNITGLF